MRVGRFTAGGALTSTLLAIVLLAGSATPSEAGASGAATGAAGADTLSPLPAGSDLSLGGGFVVSPKYLGARKADLSPVPYLSADIGPDLSIDTLDGIRYTVLKRRGVSVGPIARYRPGRDSKSLPARLRGLDGVADVGELGGFATYENGPFSLDLTGTRDVTDRRGGAGFEAHAALSVPFGDASDQQGVSFGPFVKAGGGRFLRTNLGVDATQAARTGLAEFRPGGGFDMTGLEANGALRLSGRWSLRGFASWGRMVGDAAKSPLVTEGGSRDQLSTGLFLVLTP